jgi:hypothetical protein
MGLLTLSFGTVGHQWLDSIQGFFNVKIISLGVLTLKSVDLVDSVGTRGHVDVSL